MTILEFNKAVDEYELHEPVAVSDCRAIYEDLKPRIALGTALDVVIRGNGSPRDSGPKRVDVTLCGAVSYTRTIAVQS